MQQRIDVHCHAVAPGYRRYAIDHGHEKPDGMPALPAWSPEQHIALMEKLNISKSILSITSPGTHLTPKHGDHAADMTRQINEELSAISTAHPLHFRFFASLPLPLVDESIAEIDYALDKLGAVGFAVLSNANGVYLGDQVLDPVFAHLNSRKAVLFIHPTTCNLLASTGPDSQDDVHAVKPLDMYPRPMMEFMFDETRAIANLLLSGTVAKYPHITFIMSHCGCALPSIVDRIGAFATLTTGEESQSAEFRRLLRERFYFDLAGFPFPNQIHGLLRILGDGGEQRLVYGTDYPFTPEKVVIGLSKQMETGCEELFNVDQRNDVYLSNAERLLGLPMSQ
ncbi:amidohydrolase [Truncatella angustata]|uniref:6-methylsalicylate decarboxylase n=1 Tax=Truncatella angustata TaxID=152316 RepID=A0A9P8UDN5_9PEZI|nr:amidohydrolase [Truncatella angustata]KAH6648014.1 amidohydrolase [Truncatella angustata]